MRRQATKKPGTAKLRQGAKPVFVPGAFTLVELIVVMVVLAIMAAMIVPQMVQSASLQVNSTARMLLADLEYAQSQAIATQLDTSVTFSTADNKYWLSNASGTLIHPITKMNYQVLLGGSGPNSEVRITAANFNNQPMVTFSSLGAPTYSGTVTLAAGAFTYKVAVAPITGRVTVAAQ